MKAAGRPSEGAIGLSRPARVGGRLTSNQQPLCDAMRKCVVFAGLEHAPGVLAGVDLTRIELPTTQRLPPGVLVGVDLRSDDEDDAAEGVLHFASAAGSGVWIDVRGVEVLSWDRATEELAVPSETDTDVVTSTQDAARVKAAAAHGAQLCEPRSPDAWRDLTRYITHDVLQHAGIPCGTKVLPGALADERTSADTSAVVPFFADLGRVPAWSLLRPPAAELVAMTPAQRTAFGYDASARLDWVLAHNALSERALLGEFQLAFVTFLLLSSQLALDHWKALIQLFCSCGADSLARRHELFEAFLTAAAAQFARCDLAELLSDPLVAPTAGSSIVEVCFRQLFESLEGNERLRSAAKRFRAVAVRRCGFDPARTALSDMYAAGEDAPTIVDEDEELGRDDAAAKWRRRPTHAKATGTLAHIQRRTAIETALDNAATSSIAPPSSATATATASLFTVPTAQQQQRSQAGPLSFVQEEADD